MILLMLFLPIIVILVTEFFPLSLHDALPISNTMPQWAGSCWYYLRFIDPDNNDALADQRALEDRKSTRLNSSHVAISYAVFCLKKKNYFRDIGRMVLAAEGRKANDSHAD